MCGNLLAWEQDAATSPESSAPPETPVPPSVGAPKLAAWTPPKTDDPVKLLKATLARIVSRAAESDEDGPKPIPALLPDQPLAPGEPPGVAASGAAPVDPNVAPPRPGKPRRGDDSGTLDFGVTPPNLPDIGPVGPMPTIVGGHAKTVPGGDIKWGGSPEPPRQDGSGEPSHEGSPPPDPPKKRGSYTPTITPVPEGLGEPKKRPSTFDDRRFVATMDSGTIPPDDTAHVAKLWRGSISAASTPRTSLKSESGVRARDSRLVIKHRALREAIHPAKKGADYELLNTIGEGGMGIVYAARQASIDRTVAVKMLRPEIAGSAEQREKFLSEAVVTGDLDHPNIVPIYDLGSSESGALFYSMKRVQGTPWIAVVEEKSQPENVEILMKVADAVAFAHSRGVIHRDLKPENVMLGDYGEVLVMDWGLALSTASFRKAESITQTSSMGGTPAYMAPEMATGPIDRIGPSSDVYLLGAILYEIIANKPPHTGKNVMNCLLAAAKNEIQPTEQTGELLGVAMKAMATKLEDRYASVQEFQTAIREYQSHSESIVLSSRAEEDLGRAEKSGDYQTFSRSLFAYQEAAALWDGNTKAKAGVSLAKLAYARQAMAKADYDLGASLLEKEDPSHADLRRKILAAQRERDSRQQRLKNIRRIAVGLTALMVVVVGVAYVKVSADRDRARTAEKTANDEKTNAVAAEGRARDAEKQAVGDRDKAKKSAQDALDAKNLADAAKKRADELRDKADQSAAAAVAAKEAQEYEAYIARIGLAAAKIDENAFDRAGEIVKECLPQPDPSGKPVKDLRNWEWGRLKFLTTESSSDFVAGAPVESVAFARDGARFATGSWDGKARIWDVKNEKQPLLTIPYGALYVHAVAFSPNGELLATAGNDKSGYVHIWNAKTGALVRTLKGHRDDVLSVVFSNSGDRLLTASYDKTARLWDVATGNELRQYLGHNWWVWSAEFSPDESHIVTASQDGTAIVWGAQSGRPERTFRGHTGPVYAAAFSPDGASVVSGGYDNRLLIWKPAEVQPFDYASAVSGGEIAPPKYRALEGHTAPIRSVAFAPNGKMVLSAGHDNTVKLWDFATGKLVKSLRGHGGWVRSAAFSPDGHWVLSGSHDYEAKLWSIAGYEEVRVFQGRVLAGHADAVLSAAFSRDGREIVTASRDRTAKTWDFATGKLLHDFDEGHDYLASTVAYFPDGKRLLTAAADNTARIWDVTTGTEIFRLQHTGRGSVATLSHDGKWVLTGGDDKSAKLWNADTGELVRGIPPQDTEITAVTFAPDDRTFATGDAAGRCGVWQTETAAQLKFSNAHTGKITALAFVPGAGRVLTASADHTVGQWNVATNDEPVALILKPDSAVESLALVAGKRQALVLGDDHRVTLWDLDRAQLLKVLDTRGTPSQLAVSRDGARALWADNEQRLVRLWDLAADREIHSPIDKDPNSPFLTLKSGQVWSADFAPDGASIVTVGGNGARLWDLATATERMAFTPHGVVASANFSPDGARIVTGSWDNSAKIWNAATGRAELKLSGRDGHTGYVNSACFSPDGTKILTASDDRTAKLWDAKTGRVIRTFAGHAERVASAVFSPDGKLILTGSGDKTARIWDAETAKPLHEFKGHQWGVLAVAFSRDGQRIVTGSADNTAIVWDVATEKPLVTLAGHTASVVSVAISPDGARVLTGSQDNAAKLWDASTGKEILTLKAHAQEVTSVSFSTDNRYVLTGSRDGTAIVWLAADWRDAQAPAAAKQAEAAVANPLRAASISER